tara:strand:- start:99 stop:947 length:849 start_codon:yes stop_codon:yes gene_type:complete
MIFWIASYPKSGNTWLRSLLTSYYFSEDGIFDQKLLKNIGQFPEKKHFVKFKYNSKIVTDTSRFWIKAQEKLNKDNKLKFFKTHNILGAIDNNYFTNKKNTLGAIYILRDPRNIVTSIQNHYELSAEEAIDFMLNEKKFIYDFHKKNDFSDFQFISSWEKNYKSWLKQDVIPLKIIKYEDLYTETFNVLKETIKFIEIKSGNKGTFNIQKAKNSVKSTTFDNMKKIENKEGFLESVLSKKKESKVPFFHLGPKNNWKNIYDQDYQKKLFSLFKNNLKELNYI